MDEDNGHVLIPRSVLKPFSDFAGELFSRNYNALDHVVSISRHDEWLELDAGEFFALRQAVAAAPPAAPSSRERLMEVAWRLHEIAVSHKGSTDELLEIVECRDSLWALAKEARTDVDGVS